MISLRNIGADSVIALSGVASHRLLFAALVTASHAPAGASGCSASPFSFA